MIFIFVFSRPTIASYPPAVHVDLFEKFLHGIFNQGRRHLLAVARAVLFLDKSLQLSQSVGVVGDLSEGLPHRPRLVEAPVSLVGPADPADVPVVLGVRIVEVVACDNASPDDLP